MKQLGVTSSACVWCPYGNGPAGPSFNHFANTLLVNSTSIFDYVARLHINLGAKLTKNVNKAKNTYTK